MDEETDKYVSGTLLGRLCFSVVGFLSLEIVLYFLVASI